MFLASKWLGEIRFRYTVLCSWGPDWDRKQKPTQLCNPEFSVENKPADAQKAKLNFWLSAQPPSTMGSLKNITNPRVVIVMVPKEMLASSYHQSDLNLPWLAAESTLRLHWLYKVVVQWAILCFFIKTNQFLRTVVMHACDLRTFFSSRTWCGLMRDGQGL